MFDDNMCQGNNVMIPMQGIYITSGYSQRLGYKYQGAMLIGLNRPVRAGQKIPLSITWSDYQGLRHSLTIRANVVVPPKNLRFGRAMPGMTM